MRPPDLQCGRVIHMITCPQCTRLDYDANEKEDIEDLKAFVTAWDKENASLEP